MVDVGMLCDDADTGPRNKNTLAGCYEQGVAAYDPGSQTIVSVYMSAKRQIGINGIEFNSPYQCNMTTLKIDPIQGPVPVVSDVLMTDNDGDRPCNHPRIRDIDDSIAPDAYMLCYGTTEFNNNNVDWACEMRQISTGIQLAALTPLSNINGSNDGAGDVTHINGDYSRFMVAYNQNSDTTEISGFRIEATPGGEYAYNLVKEFEQREIDDPTNIDRHDMLPGPLPGTVITAYAKGNNRPPENGAKVAVINYSAAIDGNDGNQDAYRNTSYIMRSDPGDDMYANSPEIELGPMVGGVQYYYVANTTTDGDGKNGNDKGLSDFYLHSAYFDANQDIQLMGTQGQAGTWLTHSSLVSAPFGADGELAALAVSSSITGSGPGSVKGYYYDAAVQSFNSGPNIVAYPLGTDSGYLANIYGNNPNNQGRDFVYAIPVPNPGYNVDNGYQKGVESFIFTQAGGMTAEPLNDKNAGFWALVPAHTPGCELPDDPQDNDDVGDGTGGEGGDGTPDPTPETKKSGTFGGCATSGSSGLGGSLLFILGAFVVIRRRRLS